MSKGHVPGKVRKNGACLKDTLFMNRQMPGADETACMDSNYISPVDECPEGMGPRYMEAFRADMCLVIGQKEISIRRTPCS